MSEVKLQEYQIMVPVRDKELTDLVQLAAITVNDEALVKINALIGEATQLTQKIGAKIEVSLDERSVLAKGSDWSGMSGGINNHLNFSEDGFYLSNEHYDFKTFKVNRSFLTTLDSNSLNMAIPDTNSFALFSGFVQRTKKFQHLEALARSMSEAIKNMPAVSVFENKSSRLLYAQQVIRSLLKNDIFDTRSREFSGVAREYPELFGAA